MKKPHAVMAAFIDLSKAFNRVDHSLVVQDLFDMKTPPWLLRIVVSYLSDRSMVLSYKGATSTNKSLPGGTPQGAFLGGLIFMIKFNGAFLRPSVPRPISLTSKSTTVKFVDDGAIAVSVDLKALVTDERSKLMPLTYHERTGHMLPVEDNLLQGYITDLQQFASQNKMQINTVKTCAMLFNKSRVRDFPLEIQFDDGQNLTSVEEIKLVGVVITDDLRWEKNTEFICHKARKKLWLLRRMKSLDLTNMQMLDVYCKEVRSILEMCVPVWHPGISKKQAAQIERIQKIAFRIILGSGYFNYDHALKTLKVDTLQKRRITLCKTFATKNLKSEHSFFEYTKHAINTRASKSEKVSEYRCNTKRFEKSTLPYLAKLINQTN